MGRKYRLVIFDFDGTLADSFPFFVRVFNQLADRHGFTRVDPDLIPSLRHYSARRMMRHVGLPAWKLPLVGKSFMTLMKREAASISLFEDVDAVLRALAAAGIPLAVVSSNSHENVRQILGPANAQWIEQFECGMSIFGKRARIEKVLRRAAIPGPEAIYIGDQPTDAEAARTAAVAFGAVQWGYGSIESLRAHAPAEEFARVSDILKLV